MTLLDLAQNVTTFFEQIEPGVTAAVKVGTALGPVGSAGIKVIQKGKQFITYWIERQKPKPEPTPKRSGSSGLETVKDTTKIVTKQDVAILIDINRRMLVDVAQYLDEKQIDADLLIVTNDPAYSGQIKFLPVNQPEEWVEMVREFNGAMNAIKREVGKANLHLFLSTPLPLAFGIGSVWGTVDEATVYHWEAGTYHPVMPITRALRQ
ncbi:MAG: SAVED domain-containing protein [Anaerolineales bacterium]|nr:SAVED domain-containing protein [Anaerolineales bacterium]